MKRNLPSCLPCKQRLGGKCQLFARGMLPTKRGLVTYAEAAFFTLKELETLGKSKGVIPQAVA